MHYFGWFCVAFGWGLLDLVGGCSVGVAISGGYDLFGCCLVWFWIWRVVGGLQYCCFLVEFGFLGLRVAICGLGYVAW